MPSPANPVEARVEAQSKLWKHAWKQGVGPRLKAGTAASRVATGRDQGAPLIGNVPFLTATTPYPLDPYTYPQFSFKGAVRFGSPLDGCDGSHPSCYNEPI